MDLVWMPERQELSDRVGHVPERYLMRQGGNVLIISQQLAIKLLTARSITYAF